MTVIPADIKRAFFQTKTPVEAGGIIPLQHATIVPASPTHTAVIAARGASNDYHYVKSSQVFPAASQSAMLALTAWQGDICKRSDDGKSYMLNSNSPSTLADWVDIGGAGGSTALPEGEIGFGNATSDGITSSENLMYDATNGIQVYRTTTGIVASFGDVLDPTTITWHSPNGPTGLEVNDVLKAAKLESANGVDIDDGLFTIAGVPHAHQMSAGCVDTPVVTDNGDGSVTIGDHAVSLYNNTAGDGMPQTYTVTGGTFAFTDGVTSYIVGNYNSGSPVMSMITDVSLINETTVSPIVTVFRSGTVLHTLNWDSLGSALGNKIHQSIVKTQRYRRESGLGVTESGTRNVNVAAGKIWVGANGVSIDAVASSTDNIRYYARTGGTWVFSLVTQYNNTQYSDGTNTQTLSNNRYAVNWIYRGVESQKHIYMVLGNGDYTLSEAQASQPPASLPTAISSHATLVGRIIVVKNAATATQINSAFEYVFSASGSTSSSGSNGYVQLSDGIGGFTSNAGLSFDAATGLLVTATSEEALHVRYGINTGGTQSRICYEMFDSANNPTCYAESGAEIIDNTDTLEDGAFVVKAMTAGTITEQFRAVGGKFGINTNSPLSIFHTFTPSSSNGALLEKGGTSGAGYLELRRTRATTSGGADAVVNSDALGSIYFTGADGTNGGVGGSLIKATVSGTVSTGIVPSDLSFWTTNASGISAERMRIAADGKVGIGGVATTGLLDVFGNIYTSGSIGIGIAPTFALHIAQAVGKTYIKSTTGTNAAWSAYENTGGVYYFGVDSSTGGDFIGTAYSFNVYLPASRDFVISNGTSVRMRIAGATGLATFSNGLTSTGAFTASAASSCTNTWTARQYATPVTTIAVGTTGTIAQASGCRHVIGTSSVVGALTSAINLTFTGTAAGAETQIFIKQGSTAYDITFTLASANFYVCGNTAAIASGSIVLPAASMSVNTFYKITVTWATATVAYVSLSKV
jgi:hypothetical protein